MTWRCHIRYEPWSDRTKIYLTDMDRSDDSVAVVAPIVQEVVHRQPSGILPDRAPTVEFDGDAKQFLQAIVDAAWSHGVRPTDYARDFEAQRFHLEDMRALAFHKIGAALQKTTGR